MSLVRVSSIFCDECGDWIGQEADSNGGSQAARRIAKYAGWKRRPGTRDGWPGSDICPKCDPDHVHNWDTGEYASHVEHCACGIFSSDLTPVPEPDE